MNFVKETRRCDTGRVGSWNSSSGKPCFGIRCRDSQLTLRFLPGNTAYTQEGRALRPAFPFLQLTALVSGYIAMCEVGSLQSDWPVEPPSARTCTV